MRVSPLIVALIVSSGVLIAQQAVTLPQPRAHRVPDRVVMVASGQMTAAVNTLRSLTSGRHVPVAGGDLDVYSHALDQGGDTIWDMTEAHLVPALYQLSMASPRERRVARQRVAQIAADVRAQLATLPVDEDPIKDAVTAIGAALDSVDRLPGVGK